MATIINKKRLNVPFVDLAAQFSSISADVRQAMDQVLRNTDFILGKDVAAFEGEFASYCSVRRAVSVDSGTSALELALRAYGIGPGDEVITAANSFIATALAIVATGATPVLVDVDPVTLTVDVERVAASVTNRTKAIIPVHLFGHPADMDPIMELARRKGLVVIEDACQAHGALYKGRRAGSLGHAAAFSFYPGKNLGAYGDGGVVVTDDDRVAESIELLRNYGQKEKYHHVSLGFNRRLDTIQAAVLRVKLAHLDSWNAARREHAEAYCRLLADSPVQLPEVAAWAESVWHLFVVRVEERDALRNDLASQLISTGIHYPIPIHLQPAYRDLGYERGDFPITELAASQMLSLPMYAELSSELIAYVADAVCALTSADGRSTAIA